MQLPYQQAEEILIRLIAHLYLSLAGHDNTITGAHGVKLNDGSRQGLAIYLSTAFTHKIIIARCRADGKKEYHYIR